VGCEEWQRDTRERDEGEKGRGGGSLAFVSFELRRREGKETNVMREIGVHDDGKVSCAEVHSVDVGRTADGRNENEEGGEDEEEGG